MALIFTIDGWRQETRKALSVFRKHLPESELIALAEKNRQRYRKLFNTDKSWNGSETVSSVMDWLLQLSLQYLKTGLKSDLEEMRWIGEEYVEYLGEEVLSQLEEHIYVLDYNRELAGTGLVVLPQGDTCHGEFKKIWCTLPLLLEETGPWSKPLTRTSKMIPEEKTGYALLIDGELRISQFKTGYVDTTISSLLRSEKVDRAFLIADHLIEEGAEPKTAEQIHRPDEETREFLSLIYLSLNEDQLANIIGEIQQNPELYWFGEEDMKELSETKTVIRGEFSLQDAMKLLFADVGEVALYKYEGALALLSGTRSTDDLGSEYRRRKEGFSFEQEDDRLSQPEPRIVAGRRASEFDSAITSELCNYYRPELFGTITLIKDQRGNIISRSSETILKSVTPSALIEEAEALRQRWYNGERFTSPAQIEQEVGDFLYRLSQQEDRELKYTSRELRSPLLSAEQVRSLR